jgi:hypothetical protein
MLMQRRPELNGGVSSRTFKSGQLNLKECSEGMNGNGEVALMWLQRG